MSQALSRTRVGKHASGIGIRELVLIIIERVVAMRH